MTVGSNRIAGHAGPVIDLKAYLAGDLSEQQVPVLLNNAGWIYGTGAGAVNVIYADTITLADAATETLDLFASGSLLDIFGRALTLSALKFLCIVNNSADATLKVLGTAVTAVPICEDPSDIIKIPPGGSAVLWNDPSAAGLVVSTNKDLKLEHDSTGSDSMDVDVFAMGLD